MAKRAPASRLCSPDGAAPNRVRGIGRHHLAGHQPVEQHANTGEVLLDRGRRHFSCEVFDISGDMHRLHVLQPGNPLPFTPAQRHGGGASVCRPRVPVANVDREELEEAMRGAVPLPCQSRPAAQPPRQCS
jgi:hypothetical protein